MSAGAAGEASGGGAGAHVLEELARLPGGRELLALTEERQDVALVGGALRDLLLGSPPQELDVVVERDSAGFAHALAAALAGANPSATEHGRFGTALVRWDGGRVDVAERRTESYPSPGALPEVRPGSLEQDLQRRDFTINAIALPLHGPHRGELLGVEHSLEDLQAGRLRVLHEQSFLDDPTRLLRLARYSARLRFTAEAHTAELAAEALAAGALGSISRARVGAELRLALREADGAGSLAAMSDLGALAAIEPRLQLQEGLARRALALLPADGRPDLLLMASLLLPLSIDPAEDPEPVMFELLDGLEFTAGDRDRVMRTALVAPGLFRELALASKPSEMYEALSAHTIEAIALGAAMGKGTESLSAEAEIWFERLRHVKLQITGQDLIEAGIPSGPQIGRRLSHTLARRLDGELMPGPEAELEAALEASP
jgi:tRNA nucleotidyltransferase (CCA-adding enzyme)